MRIYDFLCQVEGTVYCNHLFKFHIFCDGLKASFDRYSYFLHLQAAFPNETHFHLVQDTSIHFDVSEQTIYTDICKMEFEISIL